MIHYDMAIAVATVNRRINLQGRNVTDPWAGTQIDLIARVYDRDIQQVMNDVENYSHQMGLDDLAEI